MKKIIFLFIILLLIPVCTAEVVYDNITTSNYKTITIKDDLNYPLVNEYNYNVYINDYYVGTVKKDELIYIPDNSNISIYIPNTFTTDLTDVWDTGKTQIFITIMWIITIFIIIILFVTIFKKVIK